MIVVNIIINARTVHSFILIAYALGCALMFVFGGNNCRFEDKQISLQKSEYVTFTKTLN